MYIKSKETLALFSGFQWQDQRQWTEIKTEEVPCEHQEILFFLWAWSSTDAGCLEKLWHLHPWRYSKGVWTWSWSTAWAGQLDLMTFQLQPVCDLSSTITEQINVFSIALPKWKRNLNKNPHLKCLPWKLIACHGLQWSLQVLFFRSTYLMQKYNYVLTIWAFSISVVYLFC